MELFHLAANGDTDADFHAQGSNFAITRSFAVGKTHVVLAAHGRVVTRRRPIELQVAGAGSQKLFEPVNTVDSGIDRTVGPDIGHRLSQAFGHGVTDVLAHLHREAFVGFLRAIDGLHGGDGNAIGPNDGRVNGAAEVKLLGDSGNAISLLDSRVNGAAADGLLVGLHLFLSCLGSETSGYRGKYLTFEQPPVTTDMLLQVFS
jgi:hypothetical protein